MSQDKPNPAQEPELDTETLREMLSNLEERLRAAEEKEQQEKTAAPQNAQDTAVPEEPGFKVIIPEEAFDYPAAAESADAFVPSCETSAASTAAEQENPRVLLPPDDLTAMLITPEDEEPAEEAVVLPPSSKGEADVDDLPVVPKRRNPFVAMWESFKLNLPAKGDAPGTLVRKCIFLLALVVLIVSLGYILVDVCLIPWRNNHLNDDLREQYDPENSQVITNNPSYPEGMLAAFQALYDRNPDVRGWISFHATGKRDFLNIEYPIVYSGDNVKYLKTDFDGKKNKNGTVFFDEKNHIESPQDTNKALIVYGHNMASGQMFANLNKLMGSEYNARAAAQFTMSTLYERSDYQVISAMLTDEDEIAKWYCSVRRTEFSSDEDFLNYVQRLRDRSFFDYPVEVKADDELALLVTCTGKSASKLDNGRMVIVARKMKPGDAPTNVNKIQKNSDVIMPRSWYANQGLELHPYYNNDYDNMSTTTTAATGGTTTGTVTGTAGTTTTGSTGTTGSGTTTSGKPTDTKPTDSKPTDSKPTDSKPTDSKPTDGKPTDTKPTDSKPTDSKPTDTKPTDGKPTDSKPTDSKPTDAKPTDGGKVEPAA